MVGVDGSPESEQAAAFAVEQAIARGTDVHAVPVWNIVDVHDYGVVAKKYVHAGEAHRLLTEATSGWTDRYPEVTIVRHAEYGMHRSASCPVSLRVLASSSSVRAATVGSSGCASASPSTASSGTRRFRSRSYAAHTTRRVEPPVERAGRSRKARVVQSRPCLLRLQGKDGVAQRGDDPVGVRDPALKAGADRGVHRPNRKTLQV